MKKLLILLGLLIGCYQLKAQDLIVTNYGDSINCKITKVDHKNIYFAIKQQEKVNNTLLAHADVLDYRYNFYEPLVQTPTAHTDNVNDYPKFNIGFRGGFGYRLGQVPPGVNNIAKNYLDGLRYGFTYGVDLAFFFSESIGAGLVFHSFNSSNSSTSIAPYSLVSDDINIIFIGPSFNYRFSDWQENNGLNGSIALGYLDYHNDAMVGMHKMTIKGNNVGLSMGIMHDMSLSKKTVLVLQLNYLSGVLSQLEIANSSTSNTIKLSADERENLSRIEVTLGLKFID